MVTAREVPLKHAVAEGFANAASLTDLEEPSGQRTWSSRQGALTLAGTAIGGGVLSLSYVMRLSGVGLGLAMLVAGAGLAYQSTVILMRLSTDLGKPTYASLFSHFAGPCAGPVLDAMFFIYGNGSSTGYLVFLGDFLPPVLSLLHLPDWIANRIFVIMVSAALVMPMLLAQDLSAMRFVTPVSILALVYVSIVVALQCPSLFRENKQLDGYGELHVFSLDGWICTRVVFEAAFAICIIFAYNCSINVVPVAEKLIRPTSARIEHVGKRVNAVQVCFYALMGACGYLSFLDATPQDILNGYDQGSIFITLGRGFLSCTMLVAIPMNLHPATQSGLRLLHRCWSRCASTPPAAAPEEGEERATFIMDTEGGPSALARFVLASTCLALQVLVAIHVPGVADILSLLGATVGTATMLLIPAYCMWLGLPRTPGNHVRLAAFVGFSLVSAMSVPIKVLRILGVQV